MMKNYGFETLAIHGDEHKKNPDNALNPPIFQTSTFVFDNLKHVDDVMSFRSSDYVYTRGNNPTLRLFENRMAALEGGKGAVAFASGMAAVSSVLLSLLKPGDTVIANKTIYGSTYSVITKLFPQYGIKYRLVDLSNAENLEDYIDSDVKLIYFETPSNPSLSIVDIKKVSDIAKKHNIKTVVDNTFATPYFQRPLSLGADIVLHSATKYICGHGDVVAGVVVSKDDSYIQKLKFDYMCELGGVMSPFNAWLLLRGLKTLAIRMRQHEQNAIKVAEYLNNNPKVSKVNYPGLKEFSGYEIARTQMSGFGAVISFELKNGLKSVSDFLDNLNMIQLAVSLGDCETLAESPSLMTHRGFPAEKLSEFGFSESTVRLSIGIEDSDDILYDLENALNHVK